MGMCACHVRDDRHDLPPGTRADAQKLSNGWICGVNSHHVRLASGYSRPRRAAVRAGLQGDCQAASKAGLILAKIDIHHVVSGL